MNGRSLPFLFTSLLAFICLMVLGLYLFVGQTPQAASARAYTNTQTIKLYQNTLSTLNQATLKEIADTLNTSLVASTDANFSVISIYSQQGFLNEEFPQNQNHVLVSEGINTEIIETCGLPTSEINSSLVSPYQNTRIVYPWGSCLEGAYSYLLLASSHPLEEERILATFKSRGITAFEIPAGALPSATSDTTYAPALLWSSIPFLALALMTYVIVYQQKEKILVSALLGMSRSRTLRSQLSSLLALQIQLLLPAILISLATYFLTGGNSFVTWQHLAIISFSCLAVIYCYQLLLYSAYIYYAIRRCASHVLY
ncbi:MULTISPECIES: hypothetical protein [unclassified Rothia (in: high G+C Gram-positive bacteria)]|uniref:hypothetical protein n=1 Tax=unclassified Rothia (in: high G+C Gram-positive bacteria) TaxID=2689056 RepID=UPI00195C284D|nr:MULTISPECIES: hypothetical protein [unclassified Rothia (in: high G+C Gram-positive bacteria)]MBM7052008.1 hypothetical protein [Rothia sp. ZJ1223]QRZ61931.1 hypothetical protein JR346_02015 [Rothia sp. ZJ932]